MISVILFIVLFSSIGTPALSSKKADVHRIPQSIGILSNYPAPQTPQQSTHQVPKPTNNERNHLTSKPVHSTHQVPKPINNERNHSTSKPVHTSDPNPKPTNNEKNNSSTHQVPKATDNERSNATSKPLQSRHPTHKPIDNEKNNSTSKPVQSSGSTLKPVRNETSNSTSKPSQSSDVTYDFFPLIRTFRNGTIERLMGKTRVPPSLDPKTGVLSKDVAISHKKGLSLRLYLPKSAANATTNSTRHYKLPLLVYFHGGGFCVESAFSPPYHNYLNTLVSAADVVAVSVEYRLAPEHPLPIAYKDSWAALRWIASHFSGNRAEEWLNKYADPERLYFSGDSAGANIAHHMALQIGSHHQLSVAKLLGIVLVHPFFWGTEQVGTEATLPPNVKVYMAGLWRFVYPLSSGVDDPLFNPAKDPKLGQLGCLKVLVCVAEKDSLRDRGRYYSDVLSKSGWKGTVKVMEAKGEGHVFHLFNPTSPNAVSMLKAIAPFLN